MTSPPPPQHGPKWLRDQTAERWAAGDLAPHQKAPAGPQERNTSPGAVMSREDRLKRLLAVHERMQESGAW